MKYVLTYRSYGCCIVIDIYTNEYNSQDDNQCLDTFICPFSTSLLLHFTCMYNYTTCLFICNYTVENPIDFIHTFFVLTKMKS